MRECASDPQAEKAASGKVDSRPSGYFSHTMPLVRRLVDLRQELDELWVHLRPEPVGTPQSIELSKQLPARTEEVSDIMDYLGLAPGERREARTCSDQGQQTERLSAAADQWYRCFTPCR